MANIPLFREVSKGRGVPWQHRESTKVPRSATPSMRGNLAPSPVPSHSGRGVAKAWRIFPSLEEWPKDGVLVPSPMPSLSGRGVAKAWRIFPSLEGWPTGRGVPQHRESAKVLRSTTPSMRGNLAPSPMPSHSGSGVAEAWRIFPSLEEWPTGRCVRFRPLLGWVVDYAVRLCLPPLREGEFGSLTHAFSQRERGGQGMGNTPLFRGVADRTGCSLPHPCSLPVGEGWPKHGEYSTL